MAYEETSVANRTFQELLNATRRMAGDKNPATADARWTNDEVLEAINFELMKMATQASVVDSATQLANATMTYTADSTSVTLPQDAANSSIFKIQDETQSSTRPIQMQRVDFHTIENLGRLHDTAFAARYVWTHAASNSIAVRPLPSSNLTLRVYYIRNPWTLVDSDDDDALSDETLTDQHAIYAGHEELICLGAALRLKRVDGEYDPLEVANYRELWQLYLASLRRHKGPTYVRPSRRWN